MSARNLLHFTHLAEFKAYLQGRGWKEEPTKGPFEKLRMRHAREREPLILHARDSASQHFTTWGLSDKMARSFLRSRRDDKLRAEFAPGTVDLGRE